MNPVSNMTAHTNPNTISNAEKAPAAIANEKELSASRIKDATNSEDTSGSRPAKPVMDEYIPEEKCTADTSAVDREIKKLRETQAELKRQLNSETDERKAKELEQKLAQIESELHQKDNEAYRRQHSKYSFS